MALILMQVSSFYYCSRNLTFMQKWHIWRCSCPHNLQLKCFVFHRGDQEYLYVDGVGIKTGDYFQFYQPDHNAALAACRNASENIRNLKLNSSGKGFLGRRDVANSIDRKEVLGGFIFSCCGRGNSFFGGLNVDSFPFFENFPSAPLAGIFCGGEIGRGKLSMTGQESQEESPAERRYLHVYSTAYLVISYSAAPSEWFVRRNNMN